MASGGRSSTAKSSKNKAKTTANRIMEIVPSGQLIDKITTYDEYLENDEMARKRTVYTMDGQDSDN